MYAGADSSSPKVGEYGGNSFGYGGRSVVKTGWPKDIVKVVIGAFTSMSRPYQIFREGLGMCASPLL